MRKTALNPRKNLVAALCVGLLLSFTVGHTDAAGDISHEICSTLDGAHLSQGTPDDQTHSQGVGFVHHCCAHVVGLLPVAFSDALSTGSSSPKPRIAYFIAMRNQGQVERPPKLSANV